jgi:hypothetical protein
MRVAGSGGSSLQATRAPLATSPGVAELVLHEWLPHSFLHVSFRSFACPPIFLSVAFGRLTQVASEFLLSFNGFEQGLEIPSTEPIEIIALDNLDEHSWTVHEVLQVIRKSASSQPPFRTSTSNLTFVKSCSKYPPSSKSIRMSSLLSVSKSSSSSNPEALSLCVIES